MSGDAISEVRAVLLECRQLGLRVKEFRADLIFLRRLADDTWLLMARHKLTRSEWRSLVAHEARSGGLRLFGHPVRLCEARA